MESKFGIGDKVEVIDYGHILYTYDTIYEKWTGTDVSPEVIGQIGMVETVSPSHIDSSPYQYALKGIKGKSAWYLESQLKLVNKNPNNMTDTVAYIKPTAEQESTLEQVRSMVQDKWKKQMLDTMAEQTIKDISRTVPTPVPKVEFIEPIPWHKRISGSYNGQTLTKEQENVYKAINDMTNAINENKELGTGLRYNEGKLRYDLMHPFALEQLAKIFTMGANKYAPRNWEKGMKWTTVLASLHRHLAAIDRGEDYDKESGLLHSAHVEWNAHALTAYYKIYPQGDDRVKGIMHPFKIGLDLDGVLSDFNAGLLKYCNKVHNTPDYWDDPIVSELFTDEIKANEKFWLSLPPLVKGNSLPFEPHCYITARHISPAVTQTWLDMNGFPKRPLYCVGTGESKVEVARNAGIDVFIDDHYKNFIELNNAGITTFLYTAPYNKKYDVGHLRINSLNEFKERFLQ